MVCVSSKSLDPLGSVSRSDKESAMQKFTVGQRVTVLVPSAPFTGTVVRVIAEDGKCGGVYEVKPDHRPLRRNTDFQLGMNLAPLDHAAEPSAEPSDDDGRFIDDLDDLICRELSRQGGPLTERQKQVAIAEMHGYVWKAVVSHATDALNTANSIADDE